MYSPLPISYVVELSNSDWGTLTLGSGNIMISLRWPHTRKPYKPGKRFFGFVQAKTRSAAKKRELCFGLQLERARNLPENSRPLWGHLKNTKFPVIIDENYAKKTCLQQLGMKGYKNCMQLVKIISVGRTLLRK